MKSQQRLLESIETRYQDKRTLMIVIFANLNK